MLILTRRAGEAVMIGPDITVRLLGIKGQQVRIGIDAPKDVEVHREEIAARIADERARALKADPARQAELRRAREVVSQVVIPPAPAD